MCDEPAHVDGRVFFVDKRHGRGASVVYEEGLSGDAEAFGALD